MKLTSGLLFGVLALCISGCGIGSLATNTYSSGYRDGYVRKVTTKGNMVKVWEIEAGFHNDSGDGWKANIDSSEVFETIKQARGDDLIRMHYTERYVSGSDTTAYLIQRIEFLDRTLPHDRQLPEDSTASGKKKT